MQYTEGVYMIHCGASMGSMVVHDVVSQLSTFILFDHQFRFEVWITFLIL